MIRILQPDRRKTCGSRIAIVRHSGYPADMHVQRDAFALRDAGFEVDLICDREPGRPGVEHIDGITVYRIPPRHQRGGLLRYLFEYTAFPLVASLVVAIRCFKRPYQWVEINNMPDWLILAALIPKLFGARTVLYSREDMAGLFAADHDLAGGHPAIRLLRALERVCAMAANRVIVTHHLARQTLIDRGISSAKITAIANTPDEQAFFAGLTTAPSPKVPDRSTPFRLVTHGTLVRRYGVETLLDAMVLVRERLPSVHLEIIGDGEYRNDLEHMVDRLGLRSHVTFVGYLPSYADVAPRLLQADMGIVTIWTDFQLCNKLIDYLALGLPTITTESRVLRPYLDDNTVQYVQPKNAAALAEAIVALYADPERRALLAERGQAAYRKHFTWTRVRNDYLAVYKGSGGRTLVSHPHGSDHSSAIEQSIA